VGQAPACLLRMTGKMPVATKSSPFSRAFLRILIGAPKLRLRGCNKGELGMNHDHLGDALDHWKSSLISLLQNGTEIAKLHVLPMIPNRLLQHWTQSHSSIYAQLLGVNTKAILRSDVGIYPKKDRTAYFAINSEYDLFIDPDNGIGNDEGGSDKHITPSEVVNLIPENSTRLLLIYQTGGQRGNGETTSERKALVHLRKILRDIRYLIGKQCVFAYFAGQTSMVFVSRDSQRLARIYAPLMKLLGVIAKERLIGTETFTMKDNEKEDER
jgi:hypothetical protein